MNLRDFNFFLNQLDIPIDIHFSGYSEPAVVSDAVDMIKVAFDRGFSVGISTTLRGLKTKDIQSFAKYNFKSFTVHMPDADGLIDQPPPTGPV
jgi:MoaA/NifB/PqqE/SkfB family radical SAM enzyme